MASALTPIVKIGDKVLRKSTTLVENDADNPWVETTVNETYIELIYEFPEDFLKLDGTTLDFAVMSCA